VVVVVMVRAVVLAVVLRLSAALCELFFPLAFLDVLQNACAQSC
jgi:hypothetical protein